MKTLFASVLTLATGLSATTHAHHPFVAPLSYQTFNNHTALLAGFYDNPFVSEIAIKSFNFITIIHKVKKPIWKIRHLLKLKHSAALALKIK